MSQFSGVLTINNDESILNTDLLLKSGIPDPMQASAAATAFLQAKGFGTGDSIVVTGERGAPVGEASTIVMVNAVAGQAIAAIAPLSLTKKKRAAKPTADKDAKSTLKSHKKKKGSDATKTVAGKDAD